jgi:acyl-CoA synthetase (AMP-forming)/AMP-acid ligase II
MELTPVYQAESQALQRLLGGLRPSSTRAGEAQSLTSILNMRAAREPDLCSHVFVATDGSAPVAVSYAQLAARVWELAERLRACDVHSASRVVLLLEPGLDYLVAFYACLEAGAIAVPALPLVERLQAIVDDCAPAIILTSRGFSPVLDAMPQLGVSAKRRVLHVDAPEPAAISGARPGPPRAFDPRQLALLQYTSGSTGTPKGVMVTHGNLLHLLTFTEQTQGYGPNTVMAGWLPPHHDLGLIGAIMQPIFSGFPAAMLSPLAFLARPRAWLALLSETRATTTGAPTFAFDMCVRRIPAEQRAGLDLSALDTLVCAGEPIQPEVIERFIEAYAPYGLRASAFQPAYGLAEATLEATITPRGVGLRWFECDAAQLNAGELRRASSTSEQAPLRLVSCGRAVQKTRIVDPSTREPRSDDQVGEIWVRSQAVAAGYWGRPEESEETFCAQLADGDGPFLRTGDLGVLHDGELYVTGRIKDVIIVRGQNHYPQDIEASVSGAHAAIRPGCVAAFALASDEGDQLAVMAEVSAAKLADPMDVITAITERVRRKNRLHVQTVILVPGRSILRTTSGKLQRYACRSAFLDRQIQPIAVHTQRERTRSALEGRGEA